MIDIIIPAYKAKRVEKGTISRDNSIYRGKIVHIRQARKSKSTRVSNRRKSNTIDNTNSKTLVIVLNTAKEIKNLEGKRVLVKIID